MMKLTLREKLEQLFITDCRQCPCFHKGSPVECRIYPTPVTIGLKCLLPNFILKKLDTPQKRQ